MAIEHGRATRDGRQAHLWSPMRTASLVTVGLTSLVAYRAILIEPFLDSGVTAFEYWFFLPTRESAFVAVLVAAWLLWRRRHRLVALRPPVAPHRLVAAGIGVAGLYGWAIVSGSPTLLLLSLCALVATFGLAAGGRAGLRLVALPCLALLVVVPPPNPLLSEIVWQLQRITAMGTHAVAHLAGFTVALEGTELRRGDHAFLIIEACSGWRGIQILSLVAVGASELRGLGGMQALGVVIAAWPVGIALNIVRAALVVLTREELDPALFASHTPQGIVVLLVGSAALYGLASAGRPAADAEGGRWASPRPAPSGAQAQGGAARRVVPGLAICLAVLSIALPGLGLTRGAPPRDPVDLPLERGAWSGRAIPVDYDFPYDSAVNLQRHVEYRREDDRGESQVVDLFVARELPVASGLNRIPDSKLLRPASDWTLDRRETTRIFELGVDAEQAVLSRSSGAERALTVAWRLGDTGLLGETLRSLIGLDACGVRGGGCSRIVVRVAVPIRTSGSQGRDRAMRTARDFIRDFSEVLADPGT